MTEYLTASDKAVLRIVTKKNVGAFARIEDIIAPKIREARLEAVRWIMSLGYPVDVYMPENPLPEALWNLLVDEIHRDDTKTWHGGELTREEVESWLREEEGRG